jgi:hypothetical protein
MRETEEDSGPGVNGRMSTGEGSPLTRVTVNLTRRAVEALEQLGNSTGYSRTDSINRALQIAALVQAIMDNEGGSLTVKRSNGTVEVIHIL